jgi:type IV pilus assembly protein PilV
MNTTKSKLAQSGFSLLEVLITMLIILIGLFGIAALQGKAQVAELDSYQRAQALILLSDIVDRINVNRETATCFNITADTANGTPFIGASGTGHLGTPVCSASSAAYNTQAINTINSLDSLLQGAAETLGGSSIGAMIGARACISYDASTELPGKPSTGLYTVAVSWQSMADLTTPTANCANGLYGAETKRRTVSTTLRLADLN